MDIRTQRLNEAFSASGLTQTELCNKTGITKGAKKNAELVGNSAFIWRREGDLNPFVVLSTDISCYH